MPVYDNICSCQKNSLHQETLPQPAIEVLCQLGDNLKVARLKREITLAKANCYML